MSHKQAKKLRKQLQYKKNFESAKVTHTKSYSAVYPANIVFSKVVVCKIRNLYQRNKRGTQLSN